MDLEEDSSLFQDITGGELTDEQWRTFRELQKITKDLVDTEDRYIASSDEEIDEEENSNLALEENLNTLRIEPDSDNEEEITEEITPETNRENQRTEKLAEKYINGELTFTEFADLADKDYKDVVPKAGSSKMSDQDENSFENLGRLEQEFEEELRKHKRKRGVKGRRLGRLPKDLQCLMGESNLCFARGEYEDSIIMCMEVIRLVPLAVEPFQTLAMIYEEIGDMEKSLQFSLIAAYLCPNDPEEWVKLAEMSLEQRNVKQAITCYSKAIKFDPENTELLWARCELYEQTGERKKYLEGLYQIVKVLKPEQGKQSLELTRVIAKAHHDTGQIDQALTAMESAFALNPNYVNYEDINLLLELLLTKRLFIRVVQVLCLHCYMEIHSSVQFNVNNLEELEQEIQVANSLTIPSSLPLDLGTKLAISLIMLNKKNLIKCLVEKLEKESPEEMGDLYLDVAEAYMETNNYVEALGLLKTLTLSITFNCAAVWLKFAECHNALGNINEATSAYREVVTQAPFHSGARLALSGLLQQLGNTDDAINTLHQINEDTNEGEMDVQLLYQRCHLLFINEKWNEFFKALKLLMCSHVLWISKASDMTTLVHRQSRQGRSEFVKDYQMAGRVSEFADVAFVNNTISIDQMWNIFIKACKKLLELGLKFELLELTFSSLTSSYFAKENKEEDCLWLCLLSSYINKQASYAHILIKEFIFKNMNCTQIWNLFTQIILIGEDIRHNRFCMRLLLKNPDNLPLCLINGHNALTVGSYKHALGEYMNAFKQNPNDPFSLFCIGLAFIHLASQKFASKKHMLVVQGTVFFNRYIEVRGECQESYYNLGRVMHQLNILYMAVFYYKKALSMKCVIDDPNFDLSREIAFNLSLIYQQSQSYELARMYIEKYCVIE